MNTHAPEPKYKVVVELDAPIAECFVAGTAEQAMMHWVPNFKSVVYDHSEAGEPYGPGSVRRVTLESGVAVSEKIEVSEKPTFLAYSIASFGFIPDLMLKNYRGEMHFESIDTDRTRLTWVGYFDCPGVRRITEPLVRTIMRNLIARMAENIKTYFAHAAR